MSQSAAESAGDGGRLIVITGAMAAGKSTVAQLLAGHFERSVHLRGDGFRRNIVRGREDMSDEPSEEAFAQLRLRYRLSAVTADAYVAAGFTVVVQDVAVGPMLAEWLAMFTSAALHVVVLAPDAATLAARDAGRDKTGYGGITALELDDVLRHQTSRVGLWVDSTAQTPEQTVAEILAHLDSAQLDSPHLNSPHLNSARSERPVTSDDAALLAELERRMWQQVYRGDAGWTAAHLTSDFLEFGASGVVYDASSILEVPVEDLDAEVRDLEVELFDGAAHVTYRVLNEGRVSHRSSLWRQGADGSWRMAFHQGTPIS